MSHNPDWWSQPRKVSILIEASSWIAPYAEQLADWVNTTQDCAGLYTDINKIAQGGILFILGYTKIIPSHVLDLNFYNLVVHESDLPKGKGFAPLSWQVLEGKNKIPVCLFNAASAVDAGDILLKDEIHLSGFELCDDIRHQQGKVTLQLCQQFLNAKCPPKGIKQTGLSSFYKRRTPKDSQLDINKPLKDQFNLLRIVDNQRYPAFFEMDGHQYQLTITKIK